MFEADSPTISSASGPPTRGRRQVACPEDRALAHAYSSAAGSKTAGWSRGWEPRAWPGSICVPIQMRGASWDPRCEEEAAWSGGGTNLASAVRQVWLLLYPFLTSAKMCSFLIVMMMMTVEKIINTCHVPPSFSLCSQDSFSILKATLFGNSYSCLCFRGE